jgi:hypothetical protein
VVKKSCGEGGHSLRWAAEPEKIINNDNICLTSFNVMYNDTAVILIFKRWSGLLYLKSDCRMKSQYED